MHGADGAAPARYPFALSRMEERFLKVRSAASRAARAAALRTILPPPQAGGVERLYKVFKQGLFKALVKGPCGLAADSPAVPISRGDVGCGEGAAAAGLAW